MKQQNPTERSGGGFCCFNNQMKIHHYQNFCKVEGFNLQFTFLIGYADNLAVFTAVDCVCACHKNSLLLV
jgi:hypothetical protein